MKRTQNSVRWLGAIGVVSHEHWDSGGAVRQHLRDVRLSQKEPAAGATTTRRDAV